ncbi:hypothetical protein VTO73DRAFT_1553 [Trametes versicolor]
MVKPIDMSPNNVEQLVHIVKVKLGASRAAPLAVDAPSTIVATTGDGEIRNIIPSQQDEIPLDRVVDLTAESLRSFDADYMFRLLRNASMPKLDTLAVKHEVPVPVSGGPTFLPAPPVFDLSPAQLPTLSSIKMTYAAIRFLPSLASQLRILHIDSGIAGISLGLSLTPFLESLWSLSRIEDLRLIRCFAPSAPQGDPASARGPLNASQLTNLEIEDYPWNIGRIMTEVNVPASALVTLSGTVRGASPEQCGLAILAMLPRDRARLSVLRFIQALVVSVISYRCEVTAYMREDDASRPLHPLVSSALHLRLLTDICDDENHYSSTSPAARLSLFSTLLSGLKHMFPDTRGVTYLRMDAPDGFKTITQDAWVDTLIRFPNLCHLVAHDDYFREYPRPLLNALSVPGGRSEPTAPLLCRNIHSFELCGGEIDVMDIDSDSSDIDTEDDDNDNEDGDIKDGPRVDQLDHIVACMESRRKHGGPVPLKVLTVVISSSVDIPAQLFARYRGEFEHLAQHSDLTENEEFKLLEGN